jgi:hypothetical protein
MAKPKKRTAAGKKSAKRGKASVKPARKQTAKRAMPKKPKSKVHRVTKRVTKPTAEEKPASAESNYSGASLEELNDLIEAANLRACETRAAPSALSEEDNVSGPHVDISSDLANIGSDLGELPEQKVA